MILNVTEETIMTIEEISKEYEYQISGVEQRMDSDSFMNFLNSREHELVYYYSDTAHMYKEYFMRLSFVSKGKKDNYKFYVTHTPGKNKKLSLGYRYEKIIAENRIRILKELSEGKGFTPSPEEARVYWGPQFSYTEMMSKFGISERRTFKISDIVSSVKIKINRYHIDGKVSRKDLKRINKTFDDIMVEVYIIMPQEFTENRKGFINLLSKMKPTIDSIVINNIQRDKEFRKMGVPINILECRETILRKDLVIEYVFDIKKLKSEEV